MIGVLLIVIAITQFVENYLQNNVDDKKDKQLKLEIQLSNYYHESTIRFMEYMEHNQKNQLIVGKNWQNNTVASKLSEESFKDSNEWNYWKDKSLKGFWLFTDDNLQKGLWNSFDTLNLKRKMRDEAASNFNIKSPYLNFLRAFEMLLMLGVLFLYILSLKNKKYGNLK
jgi:hypothetical protein